VDSCGARVLVTCEVAADDVKLDASQTTVSRYN
jgi:hypothetical protein